MSCGGGSANASNPSIWGPILWGYLHNMTISAPGYKVDEVVTLLNKLEHIIPCPECRKHYINYRTNNPISPSSTFEDLGAWVTALHNHVTTQITRKPLAVFSRQDKRGQIPDTKWVTFNNQILLALSSKNMVQTPMYNQAYALLTRLRA